MQATATASAASAAPAARSPVQADPMHHAHSSYFMRGAVDYARDKATGERVRAVLWWGIGLSMILNCVLAVTLARVALQVKVVPYIVQIDEHGFAVPIERARATTFEDPLVQKSIMRQLSDWVKDWRTVVASSPAQKSFVQRVFEHTPKGTLAQEKVEKWYGEHPPYQKGRTVETEVHFVGPSGSDNVWKVEWTERERLTSTVPRDARFEALLTVDFSPVTDLKEIQKNPLGVYVTDVFVQQQAVR